jgi:hypothetical protein
MAIVSGGRPRRDWSHQHRCLVYAMASLDSNPSLSQTTMPAGVALDLAHFLYRSADDPGDEWDRDPTMIWSCSVLPLTLCVSCDAMAHFWRGP